MVNYYIRDKSSDPENIQPLLSGYSHSLIVTDTKVYQLYREKMEAFGATAIYQVPEGEASKSYQMAKNIMDKMFSLNFGKNSCLVAFGGGVVGDLTGFVASIYLRGVNLVQIPTSLLSMVDSSTGHKTAVDSHHGKNTIGSYYPPSDIVVDPTLLKTLDRQQFANGMAEVIKIAATSNRELWDFISQNPIYLDSPELLKMIEMSIGTKKKIVEGDPLERGGSKAHSREVLNFGHTMGHAIESVTHWNHGRCVAIGLILEMNLFRNQKPVTPFDTRKRVEQCLRQYELPTEIPTFSQEALHQISEFIKKDKKGGRLITIKDIGEWLSLDVLETDVNEVIKTSRNVSYDSSILSGLDKGQDQPLKLTLPGSKSVTNRALMLAALATGQTHLENLLISDDTLHMITALQQLGVKTTRLGPTGILVTGCSGKLTPSRQITTLYLGNSGTCVRFLTALISVTLAPDYRVIITGNQDMMRRPIGDLTKVLQEIGATIQHSQDTSHNFLPLTITGTKGWDTDKLSTIKVDGSKSSQYVSALLMAAPFLATGQTQIEMPVNGVSQGFINLTIIVLESFGAKITAELNSLTQTYQVTTGPLQFNDDVFRVEADATAAIYPIALSHLTGKPVILTNLNQHNTQSDNQLIQKHANKLGINLVQDRHQTLVKPSEIILDTDISLDFDSSDTFLTFTVLLACYFSRHPSKKCRVTLTNIANQDLKECRRITNICGELNKIGLDIKPTQDGLIITGFSNRTLTLNLNSYGDHRMAMSLALLAISKNNLTDGDTGENHHLVISDWQCVTKTYPDFWEMAYQFGITTKAIGKVSSYWEKIKNYPIVLVGLPGVGKTILGQYLAAHLHYTFIDTDQVLKKIYGDDITVALRENPEAFREKETQIFLDLVDMDKPQCIISTGGGLVDNPVARSVLKQLPQVIYLKRQASFINQRLVEVGKLIGKSPEDIKKTRETYYGDVSSHTFVMLDNNLGLPQVKTRWLSYIDGLRHPFYPRLQSMFACLGVGNITNEITRTIREQLVAHCCQAIELRADLLLDHSPENVEKAIVKIQEQTNRAIIFTYRSEEEGGSGHRQNSKSLVELAIRLGCQIVDVELSNGVNIADRKQAYLIGSCHLSQTNQIIQCLTTDWARHNPNIVKLVTNQATLKILNGLHLPSLSGKQGNIIIQDTKISRYLNNYLTPVRFTTLSGTSPFQVTIDNSYRLKKELLHNSHHINKYYLFGDPIAGSVGDTYHNEWFREKMSISEYHKYQTKDISEVVNQLGQKNTQGASITIPLKTEILPYLTEVSLSAKTIGAVNTVTKLSNGQLVGENTDWLAMRDLINLHLSDIKGYSGLVIGTGGVARAACFTFQQMGIPFYIWGRNQEMATQLRLIHQAEGIFYTEDGVINNIPIQKGRGKETDLEKVGNSPSNSQSKIISIICVPPEVDLDLRQLPSTIVLEQGYTTKPIRKYPEGSIFVSGLDILVSQARYQHDIWMKQRVTGLV